MHLNQNIHFMTSSTNKAWGIIALSLCLQNTDFFVLPVIIAYAHVSGYLGNNLYLWTPLMGNAIVILGYLYIYQRYIWWYVILGKNCTCYPCGFIYEVPVIWHVIFCCFVLKMPYWWYMSGPLGCGVIDLKSQVESKSIMGTLVDYLFRIAFILDKCHYSWAVVAPIKHECHSKELNINFVN